MILSATISTMYIYIYIHIYIYTNTHIAQQRIDVPEIIHVPRVIEIGAATFRYLHASADRQLERRSRTTYVYVCVCVYASFPLFPRENFRPPYISVRGIRASYRVDCSHRYNISGRRLSWPRTQYRRLGVFHLS